MSDTSTKNLLTKFLGKFVGKFPSQDFFTDNSLKFPWFLLKSLTFPWHLKKFPDIFRFSRQLGKQALTVMSIGVFTLLSFYFCCALSFLSLLHFSNTKHFGFGTVEVLNYQITISKRTCCKW